MGPRSRRGIHYCQVKGVTHPNDDGSSRSEAMRHCSVGDPVKLVPDPHNEHDRNAIRVFLLSGEQIGYISARQAARFAGIAHLLKATVHSRVKDDWGNETLKLLVVNTAEQEGSEAHPPSTEDREPGYEPTELVKLEEGSSSQSTVGKRIFFTVIFMTLLAVLLFYEGWWVAGLVAIGGLGYHVWLLAR